MKKILRIMIYILILVFFGYLIRSRFHEIEQEKNTSLNSFPNLYKEKGIPVKVYKVIKKNLMITKKISANIINRNLLVSQIDKSIIKNLKKGNLFESHHGGHKITGKVSNVSTNRNITDGLYKVSFLSNKHLPFKEGHIPLNVNIRQLRNVITIPVKSIIPKNGKFYVWVVKDNLGFRQEVKIKHYNQNEVEIEGLLEDDLVITMGHKNLESNRKISIINQY